MYSQPLSSNEIHRHYLTNQLYSFFASNSYSILVIITVIFVVILRRLNPRKEYSRFDYEQIGILLVSSNQDEDDGIDAVDGYLKSSSSFPPPTSVTSFSSKQGNIIGFVIGNFDEETKLTHFRKYLIKQIPDAPKKFCFISRRGWPVSEIQEGLLNLKDTINEENIVEIKQVRKKLRYGVTTTVGVQLGFIYFEKGINAGAIRKHINKQLKDLVGGEQYIFIDKNGWPVTTEQEPRMSTVDLLSNKMFTIKMIPRIKFPSSGYEDEESEFSVVDGNDNGSSNHLSTDSRLCTRENSQTSSLTTTSTGTSGTRSSSSEKNTLFLSYVRSEAVHYARMLKKHLSDLGVQVFLDIDEIWGGDDWQDTLNKGVVSCDVFVPLITPQYGLTQWTNREIKLADTKQKLIIPVNFLDHWPPECLAIQFATTQYLSWKNLTLSLSSPNGQEPDPDVSAKVAAEDIVSIRDRAVGENLVKHYVQSQAQSTVLQSSAASSIILQENVLERSISYTFQAMEPMEANASDETLSVTETDYGSGCQTPVGSPVLPSPQGYAHKSKKKPLLVILGGEDKRQFLDCLRNKLEVEGFETWSTLDSNEELANESAFDYYLDTFNVDQVDTCPTTSYSDRLASLEERRSSVINMYFDKINPIENGTPAVEKCPLRKFPDLPLIPRRSHKSSECSDFSCSNDSRLSPEEIGKCTIFKSKLDRASLVIMLLTSNYTKSKECKRQAFYCEYRLGILSVKLEDLKIPHWLSKIVDSDLVAANKEPELLQEEEELKLIERVVERVRERLDAAPESPKFKSEEAKIQSLGCFLTRKLTQNDRKKITVFITSNSQLNNPKSEAICEFIGKLLAQMENVCLVTNGASGAAKVTSESFAIQCLIEGKCRSSNLFHVLHENEVVQQEAESYKQKTNHPAIGRSIRIGSSEQERDAVVARVVKFCILIEGDANSAKIANDFMWNENFVIPIVSSGGAASGDFGCKTNDVQIPPVIDKSDWKLLKRSDASPSEVAEAVVSIIKCLIRVRSRSLERKPRSGHKRSVERRTRTKRIRNSKIAAGFIFHGAQ